MVEVLLSYVSTLRKINGMLLNQTAQSLVAFLLVHIISSRSVQQSLTTAARFQQVEVDVGPKTDIAAKLCHNCW